MRPYLTFAMVAPLASFGAIAAGERRDGWDRPARSAVLGLVAACLGLTREDEEGQGVLARGYGLAVLCHASGGLMTDYHTVQSGRPRRNWRPATRAEELSDSNGLNPILTRRDYRAGAWHLGALWQREDTAPWTLEAIAGAMEKPFFTPSIGRKCCPPGLPLAPRVTEASDAPSALRERHRTGPETLIRAGDRSFRDRFSDKEDERRLLVVLDAADLERHGGTGRLLRREIRRDEPLSRNRWQFGLREEAVLLCEETSGP